jgi:ERCC4-type nuclease
MVTMTQLTIDKSLTEQKKNGSNGLTPTSVKETKINDEEDGFQILWVDVHEPEEIVEALRTEKGIMVRVKSMVTSDYAFSTIGIERKTLNDFYNSIVHGDKHIWDQVRNLKTAFERPYLIVERWDNNFFLSPNMRKCVLGALASISLMGINVVTLQGKEKNSRDFVDFVSYLFFSSDKKKLSMKPIPDKSKTMKREDVISDVMCMIPGIGRTQADEIARRVQSVEEVCKLSDDELRAMTKHLGTKRIAYVRWVLNGKEKPADEND